VIDEGESRMTDVVKYVREGKIARIVMNDGKVNVMSLDMLEALHDAFDRAARDGAVVVLSSDRPGVFSAGFDIKLFAANDAKRSHAMVKAGADLALKILSFPLPVLSACRGHAFPMGAFLLLASDVRIGAEGGYKIGLNEVAIGIPVPSFALELARQRLHPAYLSRTATTGEMYAPGDAALAGFLDRVAPADEFEALVDRTANDLARIHLPSHALVKKRLRGGAIAAVSAAIESELTVETYMQSASRPSAIRLPGAA
jgi:enoyl-CoA hydratase